MSCTFCSTDCQRCEGLSCCVDVVMPRSIPSDMDACQRLRITVRLPSRRLQVRISLLLGSPAPGVKAEDAVTPLAAFELTGLDEVRAKHTDTGKISAHFR